MYFVIQRCRRCDEWIRREIKLLDTQLNMNVRRFKVNVQELERSADTGETTTQPNVESENLPGSMDSNTEKDAESD